MFDFRYHALTIASVFLALMIGLLLGIAIGDAGLVSSAGNDVRASLRGDVREARAESARLRAELRRQDLISEDLYPLVVDGKLPGERVGIIGLGQVPDSIVRDVRLALRDTGGRLAGIATVREPVPESALPNLARTGVPAPRNAKSDPVEAAEDYGRTLGISLMRGGPTVTQARRGGIFESASGAIGGGLDSIVLVRQPVDAEGDELEVTEAFENGLVEGLTVGGDPVVGAEETSTTPSQVPWFSERRLSSVDNVDELTGKVSLVLALAGAQGAYGVKDTAEALLPSASG